MTITNGYCTLSEIKEAERLNIAVTTYDTALEGIIEAVSREIDKECGRYFYKDASDATRYFKAVASDHVYIGDFVSVTTLATDGGDRSYSNTWTVDTDYDLWPYSAALDGEPYMMIETAPQHRYSFPVGLAKGVKVVGKWGWPAVPKPIKEACILWSMRAYKRYATPLGVSAMTALGEMQVKVPPADPDVVQLLSGYVIRRFA